MQQELFEVEEQVCVQGVIVGGDGLEKTITVRVPDWFFGGGFAVMNYDIELIVYKKKIEK